MGSSAQWLDALNPAQLEAVTYGGGPLLVVAGAGTGKTRTLAYRVAHLVSQGTPPDRVLLLTFTRRAAEEMLKRATAAVSDETISTRVWGGTFHATANRLLRLYGKSAGLSSDFTIMDRTDAEDLLNVVGKEWDLPGRTRDSLVKARALTSTHVGSTATRNWALC